MKYFNGCWYFRGQTYATLREALLVVWLERRA